MEMLLKNGLVVDGLGKRKVDIWVREGRIAETGQNLVRPGISVDLTGKLVMPGLVDIHVHLREPGQEGKETIASGTAAAARGGFTAVGAMPNTEPAVDTPLMVELMLAKAKTAGWVRVLPVGAITKGRQGKEIAEMGLMHQSGAVAFSDDGNWVQDSRVMLNAMLYAAQWDLLLISHPEDPSLSAGGVMNAGSLSDRLGLKGLEPVAEIAAVERDIALAEASGCRLHLTHLSTKGAVEAVRRAKNRGVRVTADVTPHHLLLTEAACNNYNTLAKVNPPLRRRDDCKALLEGLMDGTIDAIATDHALHKEEEKLTTFDEAPFGIIGLETAWGLLWANFVAKDILPIEVLAEKFTASPRKLLGLPELNISAGSVADITVIDPERKSVVELDSLLSKAKNTPFGGWSMSGLPVMTIVGGQVVMLNGTVGNAALPTSAKAQVI